MDRKIMRVSPTISREISLDPQDAVCDHCWRDLWFQMVFYYRNQMSA